MMSLYATLRFLCYPQLFCLLSLTLLYSCGGGGGGSSAPTPPPPQPTASFSASATTLSTRQTLGEASATQDFTVTNSGSASGSFSLSTSASWITLSSTSGTLAAGSSQTITATLACEVPATRTGTITLSGGSGGSVQISVSHSCSAPPIQINIAIQPPAGDGVFQENATSSFSFTIQSTWSDQGPVAYSLTSTNSINFDQNSGSIALNETVEVGLIRVCDHLGETTGTITITINDVAETLQWTTACTGNVIERISVEYFQGPRTAVVDHIADGNRWNTMVQPSSYMVANRQTITKIVIRHLVNDTPTIDFALNSAAAESSLVSQSATVQVADREDAWQTEAVFNLPAATTRVTDGWILSLIWNTVTSGSPVAFRFDELMASVPAEDERIDNIKLGVLDVEPLHIKFVPITTKTGTPEFTTDSYLKHPKDLLPTAVLTQEIDKPLTVEAEDVRLNDVLLLLSERWFRESLNPLVFYHGIVELGDDSLEPCGIAYVPGQAAVSELAGTECNEYTIAHEFGHNLNLDHSPGCGAPDPDLNFPYLNGRIGTEDGWLLSSQTYLPSEMDHYDVMGYCNDRGQTFIARYHFAKAAQNTESRRDFLTASLRESEVQISLKAQSSQPMNNLIVTGKLDKYGNWTLFSLSLSELRAPDAVTPDSSPFKLVVTNTASGETITTRPLNVTRVVHSDEFHWALSLPLPSLPAFTSIQIQDTNGNVYLEHDLNEKLATLTEKRIYLHRSH